MDLSEINPPRYRTEITKWIRKNTTRDERRPPSTTEPVSEPPRNTSWYKKRGGKRLRLVQVDSNGKDVEEAPKTRKRVNQRSVLRRNVESTPSKTPSERNIVVLYTNFTSEGDYINDHDYLINPYVRNKMYYHHKSIPVCVCLLCDLIHKAKDHIDHMKNHKTVCKFCRIDFHNVFILNLHVRCHSTYCSECKLTVTYAQQIPHAQLHNRSLTLSNIDIADDVMRDYLDKLEETTSQPEKEKEPPPTSAPYKTLKDLLNEPVVDSTRRLRTGSTSSGIGVRRSRRITRSKNLDLEVSNINEEETEAGDKTTKSPTVTKQQKLLEHSSVEVKTETSEEAKKNNKSEKSDAITMLLCNESIEDETEIDILNVNALLSPEKQSPMHTAKVSAQQSLPAKTEPKKTDKTSKKRRRNIFSTRSRKKLKMLNVSTRVQSNLKTDDLYKPDRLESKVATDSFTIQGSSVLEKKESLNIDKTVSISKKDTSLTLSDLLATKSVKVDGKTSETLKQRESDSTKTESLITSERNASEPKPVAGHPLETDALASDSCKFVTRSTTLQIDSANTSQQTEIKPSAIRDLKMRIMSIKFNPVVTLTDVLKEVPNILKQEPKALQSKPQVLKTYEGASRKKKRTDDAEVVNITASEQDITSSNNKEPESLSDVTVEEKDEAEEKTIENVDKNLNQKDDCNKPTRSKPFTSNSKARSSRSRGSLGLVEGLKGSERRVVNKPKKSQGTLQDASSADLVSSHSESADLDVLSQLKSVEPNESSRVDTETS